MIFLLLICYILFLLLFLDPFREKQLSYLRTVKTEQRGGAQDLSLSELAALIENAREPSGVHPDRGGKTHFAAKCAYS